MVESTCFQHTSSHPDKHNNSVDRIISKEEEREEIQGEILQSIFKYSGVSTFLQELQYSTRNPAGFQSSRAILHTELVLPQEILQLQGSSRADQYKASSSDCSRVSKHSTRQNKAPGSPTAFQGHTAQAGFQ